MSDPVLQQALAAKERGISLFRQGDHSGAAASFEEAQRLFASQGDRRNEGEMLNNLAVIHIQGRDWQKSEDTLRQAVVVFEALGDRSNWAQALGNLGELHRRRGKSEEAVSTLKEAAGLLHESGERDKESRTWQLISGIRLGQGRWLEALHFYDLALGALEWPSLGRRLLRKLIQIPLGMMARGRM